MRKVLVVGLVLGLVGCTSTPSKETMADPKPTGTDAKAAAALRGILKDPFSVREFRLSNAFRAPANHYYPGKWAVCARFYAKNGFGAYDKGSYIVYFRDGEVLEVMGGVGYVSPAPECEPLHAAKI
ncbi:hypothetical protein IB276_32950 [Ensifer sp. ENS04]|uniref:hypothetical protein n=1 Tax=Ensifer sp. ENS04 TaxID=2769281 RepID=UPI00177AFFE8|nr:hypothetical protein [Ensifer sp. ENS04]MBD9544255.1 hypothetical protein [Ensifer sp. ENS04]